VHFLIVMNHRFIKMSYKTNAIINRVKQTIGWQPWVSTTLSLKKLITHNIHGVKIAYFLKHWFKVQNWILLSVRRVNSRQTQIWYITALRTPQHIKEYYKNIPFFEEDIEIAQEAQQIFIYKKRLNTVLERYKARKKTLFRFTKAYHITKPRLFVIKGKNISNTHNNNKPWLKFLLGLYKFKGLYKKQIIVRKIRNKRQFVKGLPYRKMTKGFFFFPTREWKNVTAKKLFPTTPIFEDAQTIYQKIGHVRKWRRLKKSPYTTLNVFAYRLRQNKKWKNLEKKITYFHHFSKKHTNIETLKVILTKSFHHKTSIGIKAKPLVIEKILRKLKKKNFHLSIRTKKVRLFVSKLHVKRKYQRVNIFSNVNNKNPGDYLNAWYWNMKNQLFTRQKFKAQHYALPIRATRFRIIGNHAKKLRQKWIPGRVLKLFNKTLKKIRKNKYLLKIVARIKGDYFDRQEKITTRQNIKMRLVFLGFKKKSLKQQQHKHLLIKKVDIWTRPRRRYKRPYFFVKVATKKAWNLKNKGFRAKRKWLKVSKVLNETRDRLLINSQKKIKIRIFRNNIYKELKNSVHRKLPIKKYKEIKNKKNFSKLIKKLIKKKKRLIRLLRSNRRNIRCKNNLFKKGKFILKIRQKTNCISNENPLLHLYEKKYKKNRSKLLASYKCKNFYYLSNKQQQVRRKKGINMNKDLSLLIKKQIKTKCKNILVWKLHTLKKPWLNKYSRKLKKKNRFFFCIKKVNKQSTRIFNKFRFRFIRIYKTLIKTQNTKPKTNVYAYWKQLYFSKIIRKHIIIKNFLKLWRKSNNTKNLAYRLNRSAFSKQNNNKWRFYKDPLSYQVNSKILLWSALKQGTPLRKYKLTKQHNLINMVKIYEKRKLEKPKAKKWSYLQTTKINYLFKKTLRLLFKKTNPGLAEVKFLQPTGKLLSMKRVRVMASKINDLRRFRSQKLYRRFIRVLSIFFRYWHPQPLLEQIAFEMEKTKKHWPILKTMRTLIMKLKPVHFYGYRIAVRGKINSSDRTRVFFIKNGHNIPISTFTNRMLYAMWHSHARTGVFSIKGWIYFPPANFDKVIEKRNFIIKNKKFA